MDAKQLNDFVRGKMASPLSATVAALILVRAGRLDMLPEQWMENLATFFPERPDGPVLLNEYHLQTWKSVGEAEQIVLMNTLWRSLSQPIPCCTAEAFGYAAKQARDLAELGTLPPDQKQRAEEANKKMGLACRYFRPGGLLTVFAGPRQSLYDEFLSHVLT